MDASPLTLVGSKRSASSGTTTDCCLRPKPTPAKPRKQIPPPLPSTNMIWRRGNSQPLRKAQTTQRCWSPNTIKIPIANVRLGIPHPKTVGATPREARSTPQIPQLSSYHFKPGKRSRFEGCPFSAAVIAIPHTSAGSLTVSPCVAKPTGCSPTAARHQLFNSKQPSIGARHTVQQTAKKRKRPSLFTRLSPPKCRR